MSSDGEKYDYEELKRKGLDLKFNYEEFKKNGFLELTEEILEELYGGNSNNCENNQEAKPSSHSIPIVEARAPNQELQNQNCQS